MTVRTLLVGLVLGAVAALSVEQPATSASEAHFEAPGLVTVVPRGIQGVARDLTRSGGRIRAVRALDMVFAWLPDARALVVDNPKGDVQLLLGTRADVRLILHIDDDELTLERRSGEGAPVRQTLPRPSGSSVGFVRDAQGLALLVDGSVGQRLGDDPLQPGDLLCIGLGKGASITGFAVTPAQGEARRINLDRENSKSTRALWAGVCTLLGVLSLVSWWALAAGKRAPCRSDWVPALAASALLLIGALDDLEERNRSRFEASVGNWATKEVSFEVEREIVPGRTLSFHPRRDADARLELDIVLEPDSVLDVLVRGDDPSSDRGVIVCLSTAEDVGCELLLNRGLELLRSPAPDELLHLSPGTRYRLRIDTRGPETRVRLNKIDFGRTWDWDLRAGRTAFHALRGKAVVSEFSLAPTGEPEDIRPHLVRWVVGLGALIAGVLVLLLAMQRLSPMALLWIWPLAAVVFPGSPDDSLVVGVGVAVLLLFMSCSGAWMVPSWLLGGGLAALVCWSSTEGPPDYSPFQLSMMTTADIGGAPVPERLLWARHPLTRRFNGYVRDQTFRNYPVSKQRGDVRIISVGSSSTFGYGVPNEHTWSSRLAVNLATKLGKSGRNIEVINAGTPGSTSVRILSAVREVILPLEPDIVIVSLGFNDHSITVMDDDAAHFRAMTGAGLSWWQVLLAQGNQWMRLRARSRYTNAVMRGIPVDADDVRRFSEEPSAIFADALQQMVDAATAAGATLVLVAEPCKRGDDNRLLEPFRRAMAQVAVSNGVLLVEPQARLDQAPGAVFLDAVHPTALGHYLMAEVLANALVSAGLLAP